MAPLPTFATLSHPNRGFINGLLALTAIEMHSTDNTGGATIYTSGEQVSTLLHFAR